MESSEYFELYRGKELVSIRLDAQGVMQKDFGGPHASAFGALEVRGPRSILDRIQAGVWATANTGNAGNARRSTMRGNANANVKAGNDGNAGNAGNAKAKANASRNTANASFESAIHIFTNSVRDLAVMQGETESYIDVTGSETGLTMFAANYYEWFPQSAWNRDVFVYIVTTEDKYPQYQTFFPHFVFIIQPTAAAVNLPNGSVGLTRLTALTAAKVMGLPVACFLDDTVFDIVSDVEPNLSADPAKAMMAFRQLQKLASDEDMGYVGLCTGALLGNSQWEKTSKQHRFFTDTDIGGPGSAIRKVRTFGKGPIDEHLQSETDYGSVSLVNHHRPNFIVVNVKNVADKGLTYLPVHSIGEDIFFTGLLVRSGLGILQANLRFIRPGDERRPKTCSADSADCGSAVESWLKTEHEIATFAKNDVDIIFADFHMYNGRFLYISPDGVIGGAGVYGPIRVLNKAQRNKLNSAIDGALEGKSPEEVQSCKQRYMGPLTTTGTNSHMYFTHTNRFIYHGSDKAQQFYPNMLNTSINCQKDGQGHCMYVCEKHENGREVCPDNSVAAAISSAYANFGLGSFEKQGNTYTLYKSTGMYKYIKDYEYIQSALDTHVSKMYTGQQDDAAPFNLDYALVQGVFQAALDLYVTSAHITPCLYDTRTLLSPLASPPDEEGGDELTPVSSVVPAAQAGMRFRLLRFVATALRLLRLLRLLEPSANTATRSLAAAPFSPRQNAIVLSMGNLSTLGTELGMKLNPRDIVHRPAKVLQQLLCSMSTATCMQADSNKTYGACVPTKCQSSRRGPASSAGPRTWARPHRTTRGATRRAWR
jgi:hypothetical protein